jgi:hypothetical protein
MEAACSFEIFAYNQQITLRNNSEVRFLETDIIIISSSLFTGFPATFPLEPVVNPTTQASSF